MEGISWSNTSLDSFNCTQVRSVYVKIGPNSYIHNRDRLPQRPSLRLRQQGGVLPLDGDVAPLGDGEGKVLHEHRHLVLLTTLLRRDRQRELGTPLQRLRARLDKEEESRSQRERNRTSSCFP